MRQLIHIAFLAGLGLALAGCAGYRPLYGSAGGGAAVAQELADVAVEEQGTRAGQIVRNELISAFGRSANSRFLLKLAVSEQTSGLGGLTGTSVNRYRYRLSTNYVLIDSSNGKEVASGKSFSAAAYDTVKEPVADLQAAENARERAARELAQDLRLRVSAYFATRES